MRESVHQHLAEKHGKDQHREHQGGNAEQAEEPVQGLVPGDEATDRLQVGIGRVVGDGE